MTSAKIDLKLTLALLSIAIGWGTTYLAIRIAVETIPPMLVTGIRNIISGTVLLTYLLLSKQLILMDRTRIKQNMTASFMLIILANTLTCFSEKYISSGLAALIGSMSPLVILLINLALKHEKFSIKILMGVILALGGIILVYQNNIQDFFNPRYQLGIMTILGTVIAWSIGTIYSKSHTKYVDGILSDVCFQMLFAGLSLIACQLIVYPKIQLETWTLGSIVAVIYLAIFGSLLGYLSYIYALTKLPSTSVSIVTYINVVVALFLGWLVLDEYVSGKMIVATILILAGVIVANYSIQFNVRKLWIYFRDRNIPNKVV